MMELDPPIPGQTPLDDISGLRLRHVRTQSQLNDAEAENIRKAVVKYLAAKPSKRLAPFDVLWSLKLHREMFGKVWKWAGVVRSSELNLGSLPHQISIDLHQVLENLHAWDGFDMPRVEQATRLHHNAVHIHPFLNGNGRWARLLSNTWLKQHDSPIVMWPETTIGSSSTIREGYLNAIRAADQGNYAALIGLHEQYQQK